MKKNTILSLFLIIALTATVIYFIIPKNNNDYYQEENTINENGSEDYKEMTSQDIINWEKEWIDYTAQNGISFKYPKYITGMDSCDSGRTFFVPTEIFEYDEAIYIMPEYYYSFKEEPTEEKVCEKYITSEIIDQIKQDIKPLRGWRIDIRSVEDKENDINNLIKDVYDHECKMESESAWIKDGISTIKMNAYKDADGSPTSLGETICPTNYMYKILYSEENKLAVSIILGQECTFWGNGQEICFDEEIANSIDF